MLTPREKLLIENEDPRVLRALVASMAEHIQQQKVLISKLESEKAEKDQAAFLIEEKVKLLRRELFGKSSEKRCEASDRPRDKSQEDALLFSQAMFPAPESRTDQKGKLRGAGLPERIITHELTEKELHQEALSRGVIGKWVSTGLYDESTKIQIVERSYMRELHRKMKYKFIPASDQDMEKDLIVTATGPDELLPGMNYTTEFVASVVADKYISHMPLERQTREMESLGLGLIKNSTLSKLSAVAAASLEPLQEKILREDLLTTNLALHLDETSWKVQNRHEKDGYMWVISNRGGSYYFFAPTRSAKVLKDKLIGYKGPVVTDGFTSYDSFLEEADIPRAYCWAHLRREFLPLEGHDSTVKPILNLIDELFSIERKAKTFDALATLRAQESSELIKKLKSLLESERIRSREGSQKRKAIDYGLKRWRGFEAFLIDTRVPLSNNEAERTIRHAVMGRKNYYGSGSHSGADTAATLFTIIESCKKNDIDPRTFLLMSLKVSAEGGNLETPLAYARRTRQAAN